MPSFPSDFVGNPGKSPELDSQLNHLGMTACVCYDAFMRLLVRNGRYVGLNSSPGSEAPPDTAGINSGSSGASAGRRSLSASDKGCCSPSSMTSRMEATRRNKL